MRPTSRPRNGPGPTTARPAAAPTRCPAASGSSCRCGPAAGSSASSGSIRTSRARCSTPEQRRLLDALLGPECALAIERVGLAEDVDRAQACSPRPTGCARRLLTSISHDLKTPLASILGAASTLRDLAAALDEQAKGELVGTIIEESERLNRFIANLLDMTKLESGAVVPNFALHDLDELVGATLRRAAKILAHHAIDLRLAERSAAAASSTRCCSSRCSSTCSTMPPNTRPEDSTMSIQTWRDGGAVSLQMLDEGDGMPQDDVERIFEKFYRARKGDRVRAGTGLGLAISRGFVESMGGTVVAGNRSDRRGAVFTIRLPVPAVTAALDTAA